MNLFEYVIYKDEKRDSDDNVVDAAEILVDITRVLAPDQKTAELIANRDIPNEAMSVLERVRVVVRPFVKDDVEVTRAYGHYVAGRVNPSYVDVTYFPTTTMPVIGWDYHSNITYNTC